jgi:SAM-dependent methyltransferase
VTNGEALDFDSEFDDVFSYAALHWMSNPAKVIAGVHRALKHGRFVAEFGGHGCVAKIRKAFVEALNRRGINGEAASPWYFRTVKDYSQKLTRLAPRTLRRRGQVDRRLRSPPLQRQQETLTDLVSAHSRQVLIKRVEAVVNLGRNMAYRQLLARGFRTDMQGVAVHTPETAGYNRTDVFVIDDWS